MSDGFLTTHVLDIGVGKPVAAIPIKLLNKDGQIIQETITNADGRTDSPLVSGIAFEARKYSLIFDVKKYLKDKHELVDEPFYDQIKIEFIISNNSDHYHVPLLLSPYGYSTYRGS